MPNPDGLPVRDLKESEGLFLNGPSVPPSRFSNGLENLFGRSSESPSLFPDGFVLKREVRGRSSSPRPDLFFLSRKDFSASDRLPKEVLLEVDFLGRAIIFYFNEVMDETMGLMVKGQCFIFFDLI